MRTATETLHTVPSAILRKELTRPVPATIGDHAAVEQFLTSVLQRPSTQEFSAQLDEPFYAPADRLLVKRGEEIVGHIRHSRRTLLFGGLRWPMHRFSLLAVLPEYQGRGLEESLLAAAQRRMGRRHTTIAAFQTTNAAFARRAGWADYVRGGLSQASPRDILSAAALRLEKSNKGEILATDERSPRLSVRLWRQVELPALMRIYSANASAAFGAVQRDEDYWRWLICRKAFDQIFVAIEGPDRLSLDEDGCRIVGYAVTRNDRIVELLTEPGHPTAAIQLLIRACGDAIERDLHVVRLHAPSGNPLHTVLLEAGGEYRRGCELGPVKTFVRLPAPFDFLEQLGGLLRHRLAAAGLELPVELGLLVGGERWQFTFRQSGNNLVAGKLGRSYVSCGHATWTRLMLGCCDAAKAFESGELDASTSLAKELVQVLFPKVPVWCPTWDDLEA